jgi:hypothetical protein
MKTQSVVLRAAAKGAMLAPLSLALFAASASAADDTFAKSMKSIPIIGGMWPWLGGLILFLGIWKSYKKFNETGKWGPAISMFAFFFMLAIFCLSPSLLDALSSKVQTKVPSVVEQVPAQ